jgi:hypothetical protein
LVLGVALNIIKGDTIFLCEKVEVDHIINENVPVFDFGERKLLSNHAHHDDNSVKLKTVRLKVGTENSSHNEDVTVACINNHGGGKNCSTYLNINKGRCTFNSSTCMDYNGIFTNCVNASSGARRYINFIESDCDYAMGRGYCFNEDELL